METGFATTDTLGRWHVLRAIDTRRLRTCAVPRTVRDIQGMCACAVRKVAHRPTAARQRVASFWPNLVELGRRSSENTSNAPNEMVDVVCMLS